MLPERTPLHVSRDSDCNEICCSALCSVGVYSCMPALILTVQWSCWWVCRRWLHSPEVSCVLCVKLNGMFIVALSEKWWHIAFNTYYAAFSGSKRLLFSSRFEQWLMEWWAYLWSARVRCVIVFWTVILCVWHTLFNPLVENHCLW